MRGVYQIKHLSQLFYSCIESLLNVDKNVEIKYEWSYMEIIYVCIWLVLLDFSIKQREVLIEEWRKLKKYTNQK